jgi:hypothetical protein
VSAATAKADLIQSLIGGGCGPTTNAFAQWGDSRSYDFASGFESNGAGWTLAGGAKVVAGNEPFYLHSDSDNSSLLLPSGATATSPALCFGLLDPGLRFLAVAPSGSGTLHVQLVARGLLGVLSVIDGVPAGTKTIQVVLTSSDDVQVDDLYIDPWENR